MTTLQKPDAVFPASAFWAAGARSDRVCTEKGVELILLAIPSLDGKNKKEMIEICCETNCKLKVLPGINDLIYSKPMVQNLREVDISDLLSRDAVKLDNTRLGGMLRGKTILVTGGGGSIGSELCRPDRRGLSRSFW